MRRRSMFPPIITVLVLAIVFGSIGFITAYYRFSGQIAREKLEREKEQELLQALIKAQEGNLYNINKNNETPVTHYNDTIDKKTQLVYKTFYTQCEHTIEENEKPSTQLIGLNKDGLEEYLKKDQSDWEVESFSKEEVILRKQINKVCSDHYLVSVNKGYITVYKYYENSNKKLVDQTDIPINILPVVDQEKLLKGILLETMEEVNQLLEDYSS